MGRGLYRSAALKTPGVALVDVDWDAIGARPKLPGQLWVTCKVRFPHICAITDETIPRCALAWRPVTNLGNRMERISLAGMAILLRRNK